MSMRFRRTMKIGPGLRLNIGKNGMSLSAGVRGARVTLGNGRVTRTVGIPGSGVSWTETRSTRPRAQGSTQKDLQAQRAMIASYNLQRENENYQTFLKIGNSSDPLRHLSDFDRDLKSLEFAPELYGKSVLTRSHFIRLAVKNHTHWFWAGAGFFFLTAIGGSTDFTYTSFSLLWLCLAGWLLQFPALFLYGVHTSKALKAANENEIENLRQAHPQAETSRIAKLTSLYNGDVSSTEIAVEEALTSFSQDLQHLPHEINLNVSFELRDGHTIVLDTDLPEFERVVIQESKKVLKTGEISAKPKKEKDLNLEYATGVIGLAFNLATRVLNTSPNLKFVEIAGYTQRMDRSNGKIRDQYIYKILFDRDQIADLNLEEIDPLEALKLFKAEVAINKQNFLSEIEVKAAV